MKGFKHQMLKRVAEDQAITAFSRKCREEWERQDPNLRARYFQDHLTSQIKTGEPELWRIWVKRYSDQLVGAITLLDDVE